MATIAQITIKTQSEGPECPASSMLRTGSSRQRTGVSSMATIQPSGKPATTAITRARIVFFMAASGRSLQSLPIYAPTGNQHVEGLSHAGGGNEMLELERHLGALLGEAAIFKGIGELVGLADPHQEL